MPDVTRGSVENFIYSGKYLISPVFETGGRKSATEETKGGAKVSDTKSGSDGTSRIHTDPSGKYLTIAYSRNMRYSVAFRTLHSLVFLGFLIWNFALSFKLHLLRKRSKI